jgi:hypothetical protein
LRGEGAPPAAIEEEEIMLIVKEKFFWLIKYCSTNKEEYPKLK